MPIRIFPKGTLALGKRHEQTQSSECERLRIGSLSKFGSKVDQQQGNLKSGTRVKYARESVRSTTNLEGGANLKPGIERFISDGDTL